MASFQDRLNQALNLRNLKPVDLADRTGLSKPRISQYTNGKYKPKSDALFKLATALEVSPEWLKGGNVPMDAAPGSYEKPVTSNVLKAWEQIEKKVQQEAVLFDMIKKKYGSSVIKLLVAYLELNAAGKKRALESVQDLGALERYRAEE